MQLPRPPLNQWAAFTHSPNAPASAAPYCVTAGAAPPIALTAASFSWLTALVADAPADASAPPTAAAVSWPAFSMIAPICAAVPAACCKPVATGANGGDAGSCATAVARSANE